MENKNEGSKKKKILGELNSTTNKIDRYCGNITQKLYRCPRVDNSLRIYGEGKTQIPMSSPAVIDPLAKIQDKQALY